MRIVLVMTVEPAIDPVAMKGLAPIAFTSLGRGAVARHPDIMRAKKQDHGSGVPLWNTIADTGSSTTSRAVMFCAGREKLCRAYRRAT